MRILFWCVTFAVAAMAGPSATAAGPQATAGASLPSPATPAAPAPDAAQPATDGLRISLGAASAQPGGVVRLTLHTPARLARATARVFDTDVPLDAADADGTWQALLGIDLDVKAGIYPVAVTAVDAVTEQTSVAEARLPVLPRRFPTRRLRVAPRFVDPPAGEVARILAEAAQLSEVFASRTPRQWRGPFRAPAPGTPNSNFGLRSVFNGQARNPHAGVDYRGPTGQPITAPDAGTVVLAGDLYFTGQTVIVDHGAVRRAGRGRRPAGCDRTRDRATPALGGQAARGAGGPARGHRRAAAGALAATISEAGRIARSGTHRRTKGPPPRSQHAMPLFEYACRECSHQFETLVRGTQTPECPSCHTTKLERRQSTFAARSSGGDSFVSEMPTGGGACGSCGDPRGPGACSIN